MHWHHRSLRRRLELWLLLPLLLICTTILIEAYFTASDSANKAYDRALRGSALAIADRIIRADGELQVDLPYVALEMLTSGGQDRVFYKVTGPHEQFVTGYQKLPEAAKEDQKSSPYTYYDATFRGDPIRIIRLSGKLTDQGRSYRYRVYVAETKSERNHLAREILLRWTSRLLLLLGIVAMISWIAISKGLQPLHQLEKAVASRNRNDLSPMQVEVPEEVRSLVDSINALLERLANNLESMQRFIDDSAHQLKTPLAAIQTQSQQALASQDQGPMREALHRIESIASRTSHLVSQLLSLARATPGVDRYSRFIRLDITELSRKITAEWVPQAMQQDIDLGYEGEDQHAYIEGDQLMLEELLNILLDNACSYCPDGSRITVTVAASKNDPDLTLLSIEDNGPGIDPELYHKVLDRFYRVAHSQNEGNGLGLAIVREFAHAHAAKLTLQPGRNQQGLMVILQFPTSQKPIDKP